MKLETEALRANRQTKDSRILDCFYEFVLNVIVTQYMERQEMVLKEQEKISWGRKSSDYKFLDIEQNVVV